MQRQEPEPAVGALAGGAAVSRGHLAVPRPGGGRGRPGGDGGRVPGVQEGAGLAVGLLPGGQGGLEAGQALGVSSNSSNSEVGGVLESDMKY